MKKYDYQRSVRMNNELKESLEQMSALYKVNESDFIRMSLEEKLLKEMSNRNIKPTFSSFLQPAEI